MLYVLLVVSGSCGGSDESREISSPDPASPPPTLDCTAGNPVCPELVIAGDAHHESAFRGFADPSLRRDPRTGRLWLAYSWPHVNGSAAVDIHLAHSDDQGRSWVYDGALYSSARELNPATLRAGFSSHEVVSLWPDVQAGGGTHWYGIRLRYHVEPGRGLYGHPTSFQFRIGRADSPLELASAPEARIGFGGTDPRWNPDLELSSLAPELARCGLWNEPALFARGGTLYLFAQCMVFAPGGRTDDRASFYGIFSTTPAGADSRGWRWSYRGRLAGHAEAQELDGHNMWVQLDVAQRADGSLLAVLTPADYDANLEWPVHFGCRALDLTSGDPPALARGSDRRPVLRASVTASDLVQYGPGACGYEPSSLTGMLFVRKTGNSPSGGVWTLHRTGLRP
jgi:hypothetical protein